jgi:hypothetical protein
MKDTCEKCQGTLSGRDEAFVCDFGCTYCLPCTEATSWSCPNCQGKLFARPKRETLSEFPLPGHYTELGGGKPIR